MITNEHFLLVFVILFVVALSLLIFKGRGESGGNLKYAIAALAIICLLGGVAAYFVLAPQ